MSDEISFDDLLSQGATTRYASALAEGDLLRAWTELVESPALNAREFIHEYASGLPFDVMDARARLGKRNDLRVHLRYTLLPLEEANAFAFETSSEALAFDYAFERNDWGNLIENARRLFLRGEDTELHRLALKLNEFRSGKISSVSALQQEYPSGDMIRSEELQEIFINFFDALECHDAAKVWRAKKTSVLQSENEVFEDTVGSNNLAKLISIFRNQKSIEIEKGKLLGTLYCQKVSHESKDVFHFTQSFTSVEQGIKIEQRLRMLSSMNRVQGVTKGIGVESVEGLPQTRGIAWYEEMNEVAQGLNPTQLGYAGLFQTLQEQLSQLHFNGVVHGYLSPGHVHVMGQRVVILGWGARQWIPYLSKEKLEAVGDVLQYGSPWVLSGGCPRPIDDMYSLITMARACVESLKDLNIKSHVNNLHSQVSEVIEGAKNTPCFEETASPINWHAIFGANIGDFFDVPNPIQALLE